MAYCPNIAHKVVDRRDTSEAKPVAIPVAIRDDDTSESIESICGYHTWENFLSEWDSMSVDGDEEHLASVVAKLEKPRLDAL